METLETVLKEIAGHLKNGGYKNEEHVRVGIVLRILQALDWDIWNPRECWPEYSPIHTDNDGKIDVALFKQPAFEKAALFIEVKAVGKLQKEQCFTKSEKQLEDYNLRNQASIAVLTDGRQWYFYLPSAEGRFSKKLFKKIDLITVDASQEKTDFHTFLSKESLLSGAYKARAEASIAVIEQKQMMEKVFPDAQRYVLQNPTVTLLKSLVECCLKHGLSVSEFEAAEFILDKNCPNSPSVSPTFTPKPQTARPVPNKQPPSLTEGKRMYLKVSKTGANAIGILHSDGKITVKESAFAAQKSLSFETHNYAKLHKELVDKRILTETNPGSGKHQYILNEDYVFNSLSAAAAILCGHSASGPLYWKEDPQ